MTMQTLLDTQEQGFLDAIVNHPHEPVHKLAYADWLEDGGQERLAAAYRWAGLNDKHPVDSIHFPCVLWWDGGASKAREYTACWIGVDLFNRLPKDRHGRAIFSSVADAFQALAEVLP